MRPAAFYQIRLPFEASPLTSPWGRTSTGVTGRYLFSPDLGWRYCSAELLDLCYELPLDADMCDDEHEWWCEQADELLHEYHLGMGDDLCYSRRDVCGDQPDDLSKLRELRGKFTAAVASSDVDIVDDDGNERPDRVLWDDAREYANGNWRV